MRKEIKEAMILRRLRLAVTLPKRVREQGARLGGGGDNAEKRSRGGGGSARGEGDEVHRFDFLLCMEAPTSHRGYGRFQRLGKLGEKS